MSKGGPEKLLTHDLTLQQLVSMMGLDNNKTSTILEELSRLSVAAFDIESMTVPLDHNPPDNVMPVAEIDVVSKGQYDVGIQKPIMLAHRDGLMKDDEPCPVFTLHSNDEASIYKMFRDYWKFVAARQKRTCQLKQNLAQNLFDLLEQYKSVYLNYCRDWRDPTAATTATDQQQLTADQVLTGWKFSIPGRLESQLRQLVERYEVFSFYGAGYDQVLLENYLVPYLFEKKLNPKLEKKAIK